MSTLRRTLLLLLLGVLCLEAAAAKRAPMPGTEVVIDRIAFGSCSHQDKDQPIWEMISKRTPDLYIWLGDATYPDYINGRMQRLGVQDPDRFAEVYNQQLGRSDYKRFVRAVPVIGVYDDHDYGVNDGGYEYPLREESAQAFLDFVGEPEDSARRRRPGIYTSYTFGTEGRRTRLILLDTRYFRGKPGPEADILGDAQWTWLEGELDPTAADLFIIASSIQVIPQQHRWEKWANFPKARERLFKLIADHELPGVVFLSGDRHLHETSLIEEEGQPVLFEVTSSGITNGQGNPSEENQHRVGNLIGGNAYGLLDIRWEGKLPMLEARLISEAGKTLQVYRLALGRFTDRGQHFEAQ